MGTRDRKPARGRTLGVGLLCGLMAAAVWARSARAVEIDTYAARALKKVKSTLVELTSLRGQQDRLPERSFFGADKRSNQRKINRLFEEALSHLEIAELTQYRTDYADLNEKIAGARDEIEKKKLASVDAPAEVSGIRKYWTRTLKDYVGEIKELESRIDRLQKRKAEIVEKMRTQLKAMGLGMETRQIEFMLSTVSGDDIMDIAIVFFNVKQINLKLAELVKDSGEKVDIAKRYYGMHVSLVGIVLHAYETYISKLRDVYIPRVERIRKENAAVSEKTEELIKRNTSAEVLAKLRANQKAQALTAKACDLYVEYLQSQLDKAIAVKARLKVNYDVAFNTYRTVELAASLVSIIDTSMKDFETLQKMQLPDLIEFKNKELEQKFITITQKIKK